ncbi:MAG: hypothetical protein JO211_01515 [Acidobacteriaceae bacterium]|nr:hypothetical protein [Acidobacteriaceae bacterium]
MVVILEFAPEEIGRSVECGVLGGTSDGNLLRGGQFFRGNQRPVTD